MTRFTNFCSRGAPRADLHRKTPSTMSHESLIQRMPSLSHPGGLKYFFSDIQSVTLNYHTHRQILSVLFVPSVQCVPSILSVLSVLSVPAVLCLFQMLLPNDMPEKSQRSFLYASWRLYTSKSNLSDLTSPITCLCKEYGG